MCFFVSFFLQFSKKFVSKKDKMEMSTGDKEEESESGGVVNVSETIVITAEAEKEIEGIDICDEDDDYKVDDDSSSSPHQKYYDCALDNELKLTYLTQTQVTTTVQKKKKGLQFFKGCKWAPDGTCLMTNSDDDVVRLFNTPSSFYEVTDWKDISKDKEAFLEPALSVSEGGQIYDYAWYPLMSSYDPATSCFATTTSDAPVHLWDAFTGTLRASYLAYNHLDQVIAANCVSFSPSGDLIYAGFDTQFRTFDISRPGRDCTVRKLKHPQISELNQPGIVSVIAANPALPSVLAVGSYLKTVGLYHEDGSVLCILQGHLGGVTHLKFSHDGTKLFSGGRKDNRLIEWDLRQMGEIYTIYERDVTTNQRIYFDLTCNDRYLISGGTDGKVKVWDLLTESTEPSNSFDCSSDCVNGVSLNPLFPILATASGQRHLKLIDASDSDDEESNTTTQPPDTSVKLWKLLS